MTNPWHPVLEAVETKPLAVTELAGASGYRHTFLGVGLDERRRRLVVLSGEGDPRVAAMVQADLQATDSSVRVITARPILVSVPRLAQLLIERFGKTKISRQELLDILQVESPRLLEEYKPLFELAASMPAAGLLGILHQTGLAASLFDQELSPEEQLTAEEKAVCPDEPILLRLIPRRQ